MNLPICPGSQNSAKLLCFVVASLAMLLVPAFLPAQTPETGLPAPRPISSPSACDPAVSPFAGAPVLTVDDLIQEVLARNPSLEQMTAAWQAASARYPQAIALDDPMLGASVGPASFGSNQVNPAYRIEVSQKYPFPGKRSLRGQNALAQASAAGSEVDDMRLQLVEMARNAFSDYFLVYRAIAVNDEALSLLTEFRKNAETRFKTGQVTQQDVLQADVEVGRQRERQLVLERMRKVAIARIDTLMHLPPDLPLPPPPTELCLAAPLPEASMLRAIAISRRPDLQAIAHRITAEEAALALARKEYCPDFEVMAAYDGFWQKSDRDLAPLVGVRVNIPVRTGKRHAAQAEAAARICQRRAEFNRLADQVNFEVQQAYEQVIESERTIRLYDESILPAARENIKAAQTAYTTGKVPFLSLIEAQRTLVMLRDRYYESLADYYRRRAALERAVGGPVGP